MITAKEKTLKKMIAICGVALIIVILAISFLPNCNMAYAEIASAEEFETKIYSETTIEDDFDDSCVLVIMDKAVGGN